MLRKLCSFSCIRRWSQSWMLKQSSIVVTMTSNFHCSESSFWADFLFYFLPAFGFHRSSLFQLSLPLYSLSFYPFPFTSVFIILLPWVTGWLGMLFCCCCLSHVFRPLRWKFCELIYFMIFCTNYFRPFILFHSIESPHIWL